MLLLSNDPVTKTMRGHMLSIGHKKMEKTGKNDCMISVTISKKKKNDKRLFKLIIMPHGYYTLKSLPSSIVPVTVV